MNVKQLSSFSLSLGFITLCGIIYTIYTTPSATGYELTIYNAFPGYFFFRFILLYLLGYSVIFGLLKIEYRQKMYFFLAFLLILMTNGILLSLSDLHGYWLYGRGEGDVLYHIGAMKDIIFDGHIFEENFYPISHILGAVIYEVTTISLEKITTLLRVTFFLCFPLSIYFLSGSIFKDYWERLLITSFGTLLVFSVFSMTFHPSVLSTTILPFILGSYQYKSWQEKKNIEYSIVILMFVFLITFMHPMTTIFSIVIFLIYWVLTAFNKQNNLRNTNPKNIILMMLAIFFTWYLSFSSIKYFISKIYLSLISESETSIAAYYTSLYSTIDLDLYTTIKYLFWNYGHLVILLGIGAIYICLNILRYSKNEKISIINITYSCFQLVGLLLAAVFLIGFFVEFEVVRVSRLATMFSVVTCGLFSIYLVRLDKKYLVFPFILIMILSSFFVFNIYSSEHQSSPNYQLTNMEYSGLEWIISHRNESIPFISNTNIQKNELYLLGPRESSTHNMIYIRKNLPVNFGYGEYNSLSDAVEEELEFNGTFYTVYDRYMEINYRVLPKEVWDIASKYDQNILKYDESVNSIYSNGEHENWLVKD